MSANIDWSQLITRAMKDRAAKDQVLAAAIVENAKRRTVADLSLIHI